MRKQAFLSLRVQFPAHWGVGCLRASRLKSAVNSPWHVAGCFIKIQEWKWKIPAASHQPVFSLRSNCRWMINFIFCCGLRSSRGSYCLHCFQQIFLEQAIMMGKNFMRGTACSFRTGDLMGQKLLARQFFCLRNHFLYYQKKVWLWITRQFRWMVFQFRI